MRGRPLLPLLLFVLAPCLHAATPVASAAFTGGEQGRIIIKAKINGKGPFPFFFDTGSINILSLELANQLGITLTGKRKIDAFGGPLETASAVLDSIQVGDFAKSDTVTMPHTQIAVIGGGPFTNGGPVGFLGWEFLANLVVEIDYEHGRINFYDPATYTYTGSGARLPVTFSGNFILVPARVYGHDVSLELDSGNENSGLVLYRKFVKQNQLHAKVNVVTGYGFGGLTRAMITRAPSLEIASFQIRSPLTNLSLDDAGVEGGDVDGNIGAAILREFTWTYDVPHKYLYLEPDKWFGKAEVEDHSGLVLDTRGRTAKVLSIYPNSPAAKAGVSIGDLLSGKDGQGLTTEQWHDLLDAPPGTIVSFQVNHQGTARAVSLTLKAYD